ncbi:type II toxin-antitoxin system RelE/ParE family toxin [Mesorhizobium sp. M2A.F.Ca.ET.042.01.1.1]|uniref:type II toxin-antitoxin system RelE/ParE family toxin n=1 Tax=Mesorhizobium sp. M2A.F.Ca.ET.042.01.1.1 TaxID=2496745 RepID=UPI0032AED918
MRKEAELEQLYDDIAERGSPAVAWNFVPASAIIALACRHFHSAAPSGWRSCRGCGSSAIAVRVSIVFAVDGECVLILGIFYAGRNITPELLEERL